MSFQSSVTPSGKNSYELTLEGRTHSPHWFVHLFASLSQLQVSIISGHAEQVGPGEWESTFMLDFSRSSADPTELDYSAFATQNTKLDRSITPKLSRFKLVRRPDQLLDLQLEGPDQIGFLASILGRVSGLALFPSLLEIRTVTGQIKDAIVLRGIGNRPPSEEAYQALGTMLRSFVA
jgi:hypothetical protein